MSTMSGEGGAKPGRSLRWLPEVSKAELDRPVEDGRGCDI